MLNIIIKYYYLIISRKNGDLMGTDQKSGEQQQINNDNSSKNQQYKETYILDILLVQLSTLLHIYKLFYFSLNQILIIMNFFKKTIKSYLSSMNILQQNTKKCDIIWTRQMSELFNPDNSEGRKNIDEVYQILNNVKIHPIVRLKILMFLHTLLINSNKHYKWLAQKQIINFPIQKKNIAINQNSKLWLCEIILIYSKYIQKICSNSELYEELKRNKIYQKDVDILIQKAYLTINLLKSIFALKQYILNFGRYFFDEYQIMVNVNKIIAYDLSVIYNAYASILQILKNEYPLHQMKKQQIKLYSNIIDETFIIHESLYLFFYNRYYYNKIDLRNINWFKFDNNDYDKLKEIKQSKQIKKPKLKHLDYVNFDISSFQKSYFSAQEKFHEVNFQEL